MENIFIDTLFFFNNLEPVTEKWQILSDASTHE